MLSDNVNNAFALSSLGMNAYTQSTYLMGLVGVTVGKRSFDCIMGQDIGAGKLIAYQAGLDTQLYASASALISNAGALTSALNGNSSRPVFLNSALVCLLAYNNATANNSVLTHNSSAGPYLNRLRISDGQASSATLQASGALSSLVTVGGAAAAFMDLATPMNALAKSAYGRSQASPGSTMYTEFTSAPPLAKYWAGAAALDVTAYSTMVNLGSSTAILDAIADISTAIALLCNQATRLDELFANATARTNIGLASNFFNAIKENEQGISKYICALAGLSTAGITSYATMLAQISNFGTTANSLNALAASAGATAAFQASAASEDTLFANATSRGLIGYNSNFYNNVVRADAQAINKYVGACGGLATSGYTTFNTINNATYWTAMCGSVSAKMAAAYSSIFLVAMEGNGTPYTTLRADANYSIVSVTENGTTPVSLSGVLNGAGTYLVLGISRSAGTSRTVTFTTLIGGSTAVAASVATASTAAIDGREAVPIIAPFTAVLNNTGTGTLYMGVLRCDV
jgi:hypothetical protein